MTVKEVAGKWHTVSKSGKVGKRGFKTKANAEAAQNRGRALLASPGASLPPPSSTGMESSGTSFDAPDTAEERKRLGVPLKAEPRGEF